METLINQRQPKYYFAGNYLTLFLMKLKKNKYLSAVLVISFFIRVIFSLDNSKMLFIDISSYDTYAQNILNYGHMSNSPYQAPGYTYFLAAIYLIFGHNLISVYIVQAVLGTLNTLLIYMIAMHTYDAKIAKTSIIFSLLYWPLTLYSGILLSETLFIFFLLSGTLCFLKALDSNKQGYFIWCGVAFSLASLTRSILLLAVFIVPCIYLIINYKNIKSKFKLIIKNIMLFVIVFSLVLTPWTIRNYILYHSFVPVDALGGTNLYMGNNPKANGTYVDLDDDPVWNVEGNLVEIDNYLKVKAVEYIINNFKDFTLLTFKRFYMFISMDFKEFDWVLADYMKENLLFKSTIEIWLKVISFTDRIFILFGFLGLLKPVWNRNEKLLAGIMLYFVLLTSVFYIQFRYRLPVMPYFAIFAASGLNSVSKLVTTNIFGGRLARIISSW